MAFEYARCTIFQGTDCDTDHYLVFAEVTKRLTVSEQAAHNLSDNEDINKASDNIKRVSIPQLKTVYVVRQESNETGAILFYLTFTYKSTLSPSK